MKKIIVARLAKRFPVVLLYVAYAVLAVYTMVGVLAFQFAILRYMGAI